MTRKNSDGFGLQSAQSPSRRRQSAGDVDFSKLIQTREQKRPQPDAVEPEPVAFRELSSTLFTQWAVPFEIASLLLLVALIGAVVIARSDEGR